MSKTPYRIVFFGTSDFSVPILERLQASEIFDVIEVVTQPDKAVGRHSALQAPPVKRLSETLGIHVYQPEVLRTDNVLTHFSELDVDAFVVVSYGKILPKALLEIPKHGALNIHGSLLPKYRGASPIAAAIIAGEDVTGITIIRMNEKMDEGPTLAFSEDVSIGPQDTLATLSEKLQNVAAEMIEPTLLEYLEGRIAPKTQNSSEATVAPILKREDGLIDWQSSAIEIDRKIRGLQPWPGTYTIWSRGGKLLKLSIKTSEIAHKEASCGADHRPGAVSRASDGSMHVNCGTGCLTLTLVQLEGKKEAVGPSFLNGYADLIGQTLG